MSRFYIQCDNGSDNNYWQLTSENNVFANVSSSNATVFNVENQSLGVVIQIDSTGQYLRINTSTNYLEASNAVDSTSVFSTIFPDPNDRQWHGLLTFFDMSFVFPQGFSSPLGVGDKGMKIPVDVPLNEAAENFVQNQSAGLIRFLGAA